MKLTMKKLLILSLALCLVGSVSAVTMNWSAAGVSYGGSQIKNSTAVTGYLIATDILSSYALDSETISAETVSDLIGTLADSKNKTSAVGKIANNWDIPDTYSNGSTFAILLAYNDGSNTYYNLAQSLVSIAGMSLDPPLNAEAVVGSFNYGNGTDGTLAAGGGWVKGISSTPSVPEPATGALALVGVALLFRRRKA